MVDQEPYNADGDRRIGHVEDGAEEFEVLATHKRHPVGPIELKQREIEHVDHAALHQRGIAAFGREEGGHGVVALVEDEAVEAAVDDVAQGAGEDEGEAEDERPPLLLPYVFGDETYYYPAYYRNF